VHLAIDPLTFENAPSFNKLPDALRPEHPRSHHNLWWNRGFAFVWSKQTTIHSGAPYKNDFSLPSETMFEEELAIVRILKNDTTVWVIARSSQQKTDYPFRPRGRPINAETITQPAHRVDDGRQAEQPCH